MKNTKEAVGRVTVRIRAELLAKAKTRASKKRWSLNTYIEEAVLMAVESAAPHQE